MNWYALWNWRFALIPSEINECRYKILSWSVSDGFPFQFFFFFYCAAVAHAWTHPTLEHEHTQICVLYNSSIKAKRFIYNPEISYVEFNGTHWYDALIKLELLSRLLLLWLCIVDLFLSGHVNWCLSVLQEIGGASLNHARFTFTPIRSWSYFHIICK